MIPCSSFLQFEIPVRIKDGDSVLVRFEGCGITTPALGSKTPFSGTDIRTYEQCLQRRPFPGQVTTPLVFSLFPFNLFCQIQSVLLRASSILKLFTCFLFFILHFCAYIGGISLWGQHLSRWHPCALTVFQTSLLDQHFQSRNNLL